VVCELLDFLRAQYELPPKQHIWEWAEHNVDYSLAPAYKTPQHAPYDSNYAPYTKQILEWLGDYETREIWVRKCSQSAFSETGLTWIRYVIAEDPAPFYYLTCDMQTMERFMEERIKRGMQCCPKAQEKYRIAQNTRGGNIEHDIRLPNMDFRAGYPGARGAFKQDNFKYVMADEWSTWKGHAPPMLRKRVGAYPFHKIFGGSSPDPTRSNPDGDPVILEYEKTNQMRWMMPDPKTGNPFCFEFGERGDGAGLKWPQDARDEQSGKWDMNRVKSEAYYLTQDGTRIENKDRMKCVHEGERMRHIEPDRFGWIAQNKDAPSHIKGVWIVGPMVPFSDGDFGKLAYEFLQSKGDGLTALKAYFYENWADRWGETQQKIKDTAFVDARANYKKGEFASDGRYAHKGKRTVIMTVDVQKDHFWYVVREWFRPGHSSLVDWGKALEWVNLRDVRAKYAANYCFIDNHYADRQEEVIIQCCDGMMRGCVPVYGHEKLRDKMGRSTACVVYQNKDPYEGRRYQGRYKLTWVSSVADYWKTQLYRLLNGNAPQAWRIPNDVDSAYTNQMTAEKCVDGKWVQLRKGNHIWDCEHMQILAAHLVQVYIEHHESIVDITKQTETNNKQEQEDGKSKTSRTGDSADEGSNAGTKKKRKRIRYV